MATFELTSEDGMLHYLNQTFRPCSEAVRLAEGGFSAYVFRAKLTTPLPDGQQTVIVKHVQEYAARAFEFKLDPAHLMYEQRGLSLLGPLLSQTGCNLKSVVTIPAVINFDATNRVLIIEDVGHQPTLKDWLSADTPSSEAVGIGKSLGHFLADLHELSAKDASVLSGFEANTFGRGLSAFAYYDRLVAEAAKFGFGEPFIADAAAQAREEVMTANEVLTMGDFWTGNVLVRSSGSDPSELPHLYVIDWELAKPGTAAFDVGQMAAEMYFLSRFRSAEKGKALLESFLGTYKGRRSIDVYKVLIRVGAHLVIIGQMTNPKATPEQVKALAAEGVDLIKAGWFKDEDHLRRSMFAVVLN